MFLTPDTYCHLWPPTQHILHNAKRILKTDTPSNVPSTQLPSDVPTTRPSTMIPTKSWVQTTTFYVIGDVPYNPQQAVEMQEQIQGIPSPDTADFVIHVGDIRSAADETKNCRLSEYQDVAQILQQSAVPVFIVPGDNEWNDCPNRNQAWNFWTRTFAGFESTVWNVDHFGTIERMQNRPETFSFVFKSTLFVGLNLVGGHVHNANEWQERLTEQVEWLQTLMRRHELPTVLFGHANPSTHHAAFFEPLRDFLSEELRNSIPFLYVNGDKHRYVHTWMLLDMR